MTSEELLQRKSQIVVEMDTEGADLDALLTETRSINAQLEDMRNAEAKKEELRNLAMNEETVVENFEKKEEIEMETRTFAPDTVEYRDAYMKSLMGKPMAVEERDALTSAASVIPTQTVNKIYGLLEQNPLIAEINALHIPGYVAVPKATAVNDASWLAMATESTDSADTVASVSLSAYKIIKTIEITADIKAMSIPAFESWLTNKLAQKMEKAICAAVINGTGASQPTGIGQGGITASTSCATPTIAKLAALMGGLKSAYQAGAVWIMSSKNFYTKIIPLATDQNGIVVMNGIQPVLFGHKVVFDDNVDACKFTSGTTAETADKDHIIFGNLNEGYVFNYGEGIAIEADQSVAFRSGSTVYRAMALCDGKVVDTNAFVWADLT